MSAREPFATIDPVDPALLHEELDLLIVGGGPAGTAAAFRAHELGLRVLVIDFDDVLKRIRDYSKDKLILPDFGGGDRMAFPAGGKCIAGLEFGPIDKDEMCALWKGLYASFGVPVLVGVELTGLERATNCWSAATWNHRTNEAVTLNARHVVLALGRGVPRRFDIPGNTDGIAYRLDDPGRYVAGPACVIGGGTSAAEAVIAISNAKIEASDESHVFWSYRGSKLPRVSKALANEFFEAYIGNGNIRYRPNSEPVAVVTAPDRGEFLSVRVDRRTGENRPAETVHYEFAKASCIACIGEDIPESFLRELGIPMFGGGPRGKKMCAVTPLLETQQRNVYLIGDLLSQEYLETDDFAARQSFRHVKHRGNIKSSLRDGVFIAEVIRQRLDGRQRIDVHILDAKPAAAEADTGIARVTAALGLSPATQAIAMDAFIPQASPNITGWLVGVTATGIESEQFTLRTSGVITIGRTNCDINFPNDTALSDRHASISCRDGEYFLRDEGSLSGTYLRIRPEAPVPVLPGALLRVGGQILVVGRDQKGFHLDQYDSTGRTIHRLLLQTRPLVLGRNAGPTRPDVALADNDMTLSRFHMSVSVQGAVIVVQDFGSRNGTYLKIDGEMLIEHQDAFRIGAQQLQLQLREDLPEKTDSRPVPSVPRNKLSPAAPPAPPPQPHATSSPRAAAGAAATATRPHITFRDQGIAGDADASETLLEWADQRNVDIDNECWIGMCGCDVVRIVEGAEFLNEIGEKEQKTLKRKGVEPGLYRLACMARCSGPVIVEVAG